MRRFRAIVQTKLEPEDKQVLWLKYDSLSYYNNGEWVPLLDTPVIGEMVEIINDRVDKHVDKEIENFKLSADDFIRKELLKLGINRFFIDLDRSDWTTAINVVLPDIEEVLLGGNSAEVSIKWEDNIYKSNLIELSKPADNKTSLYFDCSSVLSESEGIDITGITVRFVKETASDGESLWLLSKIKSSKISLLTNGNSNKVLTATGQYEDVNTIIDYITNNDIDNVCH